MKPMNKAVLPAVGLGVAAAATLGAVMMRPRKKKSVQAAAGKAIKAVGEAVEHFSSGLPCPPYCFGKWYYHGKREKKKGKMLAFKRTIW